MTKSECRKNVRRLMKTTWHSRQEKLINRLRELQAISSDGVDTDRWLPAFGYPRLFQALLDLYCIKTFCSNSVLIHGNDRNEPESLQSLMQDQLLTTSLVSNGFLPFGRPVDGSYDRICFDIRGLIDPEDAPVVRMDHEAILCFDHLPFPIKIASSFFELCCYQIE